MLLLAKVSRASCALLLVVASSCGSDDPANNSTSNSTPNNANANSSTSQSGSCFHNCVADGPLGQIENFGCVAPSSDGDCSAAAQDHCDSLNWGTSAASEYVSTCDACSESCAPSFYDCSAGGCATSVN